jgi:hypothetical protein
MKAVAKSLGAGGVAAFFFFSWIIQLLWNSILVDQLALVAVKLNYWQAAALWFLTTILTAWVGIGARPVRRRPRLTRDWDELGRRIERKVQRGISRWIGDDPEGIDDLGERIEAKIKRGFARWVDVDEDTDWEDLGEHIERKIRGKIRDWSEEDGG